MGQRANFAIGNASGYKLYYSHWCANTLPFELFWGPEHALDFISRQKVVDNNTGWLDTIWAEGGAVLDLSTKTLLLYGGEDLLYDVPLRRVFLKLLKTSWSQWTIKWAYEGIIDIAEYVGVDRNKVHSDCLDEEDLIFKLNAPEEQGWTDSVCSLKYHDQLKIYPLAGYSYDYMLAGPKVIDASVNIQALSSLDISELGCGFIQDGFHIDADQKKLDFWVASDSPNLMNQVTEIWNGWDVTWHLDRFESQIELCGGLLKMTLEPQDNLVTKLVEMLDRDSKPIDILNIAERISEREGQDIQINPAAISDERVSFNVNKRMQVLAECIAKLD